MKTIAEYITESNNAESYTRKMYDAIRRWIDDYVDYEKGQKNNYVSDPCEHYTDSCIKALDDAYNNLPKSKQKSVIKEMTSSKYTGWPAEFNVVKTDDNFWKEGVEKINKWFEEHK